MRTFLLFLFFPALGFSQHFYTQAGVGISSTLTTFTRNSPIADLYGRTFTAEAVAGVKLNKYVSIGLGATYLNFTRLFHPVIPVYIEVRATASGRFHPYIFVHSGYNGYHGPTIETAADSSSVYDFHFKGGYYMGAGVGASYHHIYVQGKCHFVNYHPSDTRVYDFYEVGETRHYRLYSFTVGYLL